MEWPAVQEDVDVPVLCSRHTLEMLGGFPHYCRVRVHNDCVSVAHVRPGNQPVRNAVAKIERRKNGVWYSHKVLWVFCALLGLKSNLEPSSIHLRPSRQRAAEFRRPRIPAVLDGVAVNDQEEIFISGNQANCLEAFSDVTRFRLTTVPL